MNPSAVDAETIFNTYQSDHEISGLIPNHPKLPPELQWLPLPRGAVLALGGPDPKRFDGGDARQIIGSLIPLLDGSRTADDLGKELPHLASKLPKAIAALTRAGLLEDGFEDAPESVPKSVQSYLALQINSISRHRSRAAAARHLAALRIAIAAPDGLADILVEPLRASGVSDVRLCVPERGFGNVDAALAIIDSVDSAAVTEAMVAQAACPVLVMRCYGDMVQIGPLHIPGASACLACSSLDGIAYAEAVPDLREITCSLLGHIFWRIISMITGDVLFNSALIYQFSESGELSVRTAEFVRSPGCSQCGLAHVPPFDRRDPRWNAWRYMNVITPPPSMLRSRRTHELHYSARVRELANQIETGLGHELLHLPHGPAVPLMEGVPSVASHSGPDLLSLSACLRAAFGCQSSARWPIRKLSPTGGGLRSTVGFVAVRGVAGIPDGLYRYYAEQHGLERVGSKSGAVESLERRLGIVPDNVKVYIVPVADLRRLFSKYGAMGFKIAQMDGGVALTYMEEAAGACGLSTCQHAITNPLSLLEQFGLPSESGKMDIVACLSLHAADEIREGNWEEKLRTSIPRLVSWPGETRRTLPVDTPFAFSPRAFARAALARRSVRHYTSEGIDRNTARDLLVFAMQRSRSFAQSNSELAQLNFGLINNISTGDFPAGLYELRGEEIELRVGHLDPSTVARCYVQDALGTAPLLLLAIGDIGAALATREGEGIRRLFARSGAALGSIALRLPGMGLGGCIIGGSVESDMRATFGFDGYNTWVIGSIAIGHPRQPQLNP